MDNQTTLTDYPWMMWIVGLAFAVFGMLMAFSNSGSAICGAGMALVGLALALGMGAVSQVIIDPDQGIVKLKKRGLIGSTTRDIPIREISSVELESSRGRSSYTYRVRFILASGESVPLRSYYASGRGGQERLAERVRSLLNLPDSGQKAAAFDGDPSAMLGSLVAQAARQPGKQQSGETAGVAWQLETRSSGTGMTATCWSTDTVNCPGQFLLLMQNGSINAPGVLGDAMISIAMKVYRQYLQAFQLTDEEQFGLDSAQPMKDLDPNLQSRFVILTADQNLARELLTPWVTGPLLRWVEGHPVRNFQAITPSDFGPVVVMISPKRLRLIFINDVTPAPMAQALTEFGVELAKAVG